MDLGTSSKGGKKALDSALNLVPFIDLMAVLIVFLIMSAVWTQLNRLQVAQSSGSEGPDVEKVPVRVRVTENSLQVSAGPAQQPALTVRDANGRLAIDSLTTQLAELKRAFPETSAVTIEPDDAVKYDDLIRVIDAAMPSFPTVSVSPAS